jgi:hypothetical protein
LLQLELPEGQELLLIPLKVPQQRLVVYQVLPDVLILQDLLCQQVEVEELQQTQVMPEPEPMVLPLLVVLLVEMEELPRQLSDPMVLMLPQILVWAVAEVVEEDNLLQTHQKVVMVELQAVAAVLVVIHQMAPMLLMVVMEPTVEFKSFVGNQTSKWKELL